MENGEGDTKQNQHIHTHRWFGGKMKLQFAHTHTVVCKRDLLAISI